jgi:ParB/RepB/Spo0J family partition protein
MSRRSGWRSRGAQEQTAAAIDAVLDERPQRGEEILTVSDALVEDSPYQARTVIDEAELAELAEGMRTAGFQGVLLVRAHPRHEGQYQLVYGHRRRLAWRRVCAERGVACDLPVLVRSFTDQQLLTVGAQENLQRADLTPLEEAQLVVWHQQLYFELSLGEIGALLGKSESWAKKRSQVAQLPEPFKGVLRQHPTMMSQILEVARLWQRDQGRALDLVGQVGRESLTLAEVRALVQEALAAQHRETQHNQFVNEPIVTEGTRESGQVSRAEQDHTAAPGRSQQPPRGRVTDPAAVDEAMMQGIRLQAADVRRVLSEWSTAAQRSPEVQRELLAQGSAIVSDLEQLMELLARLKDG